MGTERDDVLSLDGEEDEGEFSGFSPLHSGEESRQVLSVQKKKKQKSGVIKKPQNSTKGTRKRALITSNKENENRTGVARQEQTGTSSSLLDISKLSDSDIIKLREVLGIVPSQYADEEDITSVFGDTLENLPGLHVQVDSADISDGEMLHEGNRQLPDDLSKALFEGDECVEDDWELPRLKAPEKGKAVSESLAKLINTSCTSQCDTDSLVAKYKIPKNCDRACPPVVNQEIWKILDKRAQSQDKGIQDIQNLVATGITPIIKLADVFKAQFMANKEAKTLLSDALTLLGQVQYNLSVRRRYIIRPNLKKKYTSLCNISTPISNQLFGDDIAKEIKNCDSMYGLGKDQGYRMNVYRGRGSRFPRRGYSGNYGSGYGYGSGVQSHRFQPYPQRGQFRTPMRGRGVKRSAATATATSPNDQN